MAGSGAELIEVAPYISSLSVGDAFTKLSQKEQLYAHFLARASWHGTRIILRQVSPESVYIFDFILAQHKTCNGNWGALASKAGISVTELQNFLNYAAVFLGNIGNYFGHGDQKFIPNTSESIVKKLSSVSNLASGMPQNITSCMFAPLPRGLGYPTNSSQSSYYPGPLQMSQEEISEVSWIVEGKKIHPENTRIQKTKLEQGIAYDVFQASVNTEDHPRILEESNLGLIRLVLGDHSTELAHICYYLEDARKHSANATQESYLAKCQKSFQDGDIETYKESQRIWVKDVQPSVESILGFVEPYRDPFGIRAEFEGLVAIVNKEETRKLMDLADRSTKFIRRLPWAQDAIENDGKGPFENTLFESPDFTSLHTLAYMSSIIFPGINLPNYNDIRQEVGFKNVMITNSIAGKSPLTEHMATFLNTADSAAFIKHREPTFYLWVVFHELLGHGTGKLLMEDESGNFNFDKNKLPINPLTGKPIESWYRHGQTWTGLFGDIATSVDECRAEIVGAYLMSDMELLEMFGYTSDSDIAGKDLEYNMYLQLGVAGLRALENYIAENKKWGQAHSRAHFAIFRTLLIHAGSFLTISHSQSPTPATSSLTVHVDRSKIHSDGRPALAQLLLRLHIYRCTADVKACRKFYEDITKVEGEFLVWRKIMLARQPVRQVFVQPNTFLTDDGRVELREYEATVEGMIWSWAEREI